MTKPQKQPVIEHPIYKSRYRITGVRRDWDGALMFTLQPELTSSKGRMRISLEDYLKQGYEVVGP